MESEHSKKQDEPLNCSNSPKEAASSSSKLQEIEKDFELIAEGQSRLQGDCNADNVDKPTEEDQHASTIEVKVEQEGQKEAVENPENDVIMEDESSVPFKPKKHHKRKKRSRSNSSHSHTDSTTGRQRKSKRNPLLITLSSDGGGGSDSEESGDGKDEECKEAEPVTDTHNKGKRHAHIQADIMRKMSAMRWSKSPRKKGQEDDGDSSSSGSIITKVRRKKKRTIASRAALAKRKYFAKKLAARRNASIHTSFRSLRGRQRKCAGLNVNKKDLSPSSSGVFVKKRIGRPPRLQEAARRGRPPKKISLPESEQPQEIKDFERSEDKEAASENNSPCKKNGSKVEVAEQKTVPGQEVPSVTTPKRGRPKQNLKDPHRVKTIPINRKIKPFLQSSSCIDIIHKIPKCRECRMMAYYKRKPQHSYCRFLEYRKLCYAKNGTILSAGFSLANDCTYEDMLLWLPRTKHQPPDLDIDTAKALLVQVGDQFCDLIEQEKEALSLHIGKDNTVTWKKIMQGVREMCDVCETTLFNMHWVCPRCGLAVCIDCYKVRKQGIMVDEESILKGRDEYNWFLCNGRIPHEQDKLLMTQIIPGNIPWSMQGAMHRARDMWKISAYCKCNPHISSTGLSKHVSTGICKQLMSSVLKSFPMPNQSYSYENQYYHDQQSPKLDAEINEDASSWLTKSVSRPSLEHRTTEQCFTNGLNYDSPCYESFTSLKDLLQPGNPERLLPVPLDTYSKFSLDDIIDCMLETKNEKGSQLQKDTIKLFNHRYPQPNSGRDPLPIRLFTSTESSIPFSEVPHSWLCNGRLLLLHQANHPMNLELFQEQWKRGQPIVVIGVDQRLDMKLWHPDGFCRDFGDIKNDLVNCKTGTIIPDMPMRKFWEGFENFQKRMKDDYGEYMLLKLKDWPPGEDFKEKLPTRFNDLMEGLPLPEYTHRDGIFNLAGRLPSWFVRPDLGPKMYNAYGSALYPAKGTTNLHLDMSDAVNVMVYVGVPNDGSNEDHILEALKAIDDGGCDSLMRNRVRARSIRPGALWHIYNARDADKIRDLLNKVAVERGEKLEAQHDPIHDQSWYIDKELRKRLYDEYGVEGYAIAQCLGDAVFIPAGAPHQVRNLHSCVKVAEDFVSPENIGHCFKLTQEFRHLSDTHTNHEDKLQIKNIIYHVVKDALSHLLDEETSRQYFM